MSPYATCDWQHRSKYNQKHQKERNNHQNLTVIAQRGHYTKHAGLNCQDLISTESEVAGILTGMSLEMEEMAQEIRWGVISKPTKIR